MDARAWPHAGDQEKPRVSLRFKANFAYGLLLAFAVLLALFVFYQKDVLLTQFDALQAATERELQLHDLSARLRSEIETHSLKATDLRNNWGAAHVQDHLRRYREFHRRVILPALPGDAHARQLASAIEQAMRKPDVETLARLDTAQQAFLEQLQQRIAETRARRLQMVADYRDHSNRAAMVPLILGLSGLAFLGFITRDFFRRLCADLHTLSQTTAAITRGERTASLPVSRPDEVGELAKVIDRLAQDLSAQERDLEIERQKTFHQEKMASIGRLAAGIAHEVGNPIAAISGLVKDIIDARATGQCPMLAPDDECKLRMVLEHVQRLSHITHQISEIAQPQSSETCLVDLNGLIRSTTNLMRYDERWKNIELRLELDKRLPAISAVSDQITQVIMNLLVNAADAIEAAGREAPCVCIKTGRVHDHVFFVVEDNGEGMPPEVLARAKQAFFTTKGEGRGTGQGLSLCNAIVEAHGGRMEIHSTPGKGTRVFVYLPVERELLEEHVS